MLPSTGCPAVLTCLLLLPLLFSRVCAVICFLGFPLCFLQTAVSVCALHGAAAVVRLCFTLSVCHCGAFLVLLFFLTLTPRATLRAAAGEHVDTQLC